MQAGIGTTEGITKKKSCQFYVLDRSLQNCVEKGFKGNRFSDGLVLVSGFLVLIIWDKFLKLSLLQFTYFVK